MNKRIHKNSILFRFFELKKIKYFARTLFYNFASVDILL